MEKGLGIASLLALCTGSVILSVVAVLRRPLEVDGWVISALILLALAVVLAVISGPFMRRWRYMTRPSFVVGKRLAPTNARDFSKAEQRVLNPELPASRALSHARSTCKKLVMEERLFESDCISSYFATLLLSPQSAITRITESVKPYSKSLHVESSYTFRIPYQLIGKPVVLPLLIQRKGELLESFKITYDGQRIPSMSAEERDKFIEAVFNHYAERAEVKDEYDGSGFAGCLEGVLDETADAQVAHERVEEACSALRRVFDAGIGKARHKGGDVEARVKGLKLMYFSLESILRGLELSYLVCVRLTAPRDPSAKNVTGWSSVAYNASPSRAMRVMVERRLPLEPMRFRNKQGRGIANRIFNRPMRIHFSLANADRAQSYHLVAKGPEDTYFADGAMKRSGGEFKDGEGEREYPSASSFTVQGRYGQRHAHMNVKYGQGFSDYAFAFTYLERPPTSFQKAFISALLGFLVLVCICAPRLCGAGCSDAGVEVLTVCLSIVAAAAGWVVTRSRDGRGLQVAPWLSGWVTIATSSTAVVVSAVSLAMGCACSEIPIVILAVAGALQACNTLSTVWACLIRGWIHHRLITADPKCVGRSAVPKDLSVYRRLIVQFQGGWFSGKHDGVWMEGQNARTRALLRKAFYYDRGYVRDVLLFFGKDAGADCIHYLYDGILDDSW